MASNRFEPASPVVGFILMPVLLHAVSLDAWSPEKFPAVCHASSPMVTVYRHPQQKSPPMRHHYRAEMSAAPHILISGPQFWRGFSMKANRRVMKYSASLGAKLSLGCPVGSSSSAPNHRVITYSSPSTEVYRR